MSKLGWCLVHADGQHDRCIVVTISGYRCSCPNHYTESEYAALFGPEESEKDDPEDLTE